MKMKMIVISALGLVLTASSLCAATRTWTNIAGGDWNDPANWSPNQVPVSGDDVVITNAGTYSVTNAQSVTLDSLILGGTNGIQTLTIASLTLNNASMVNSNGVLNWFDGYLESSLTVLQGGTLSISNQFFFALNNYTYGYTITATLTNYGTVVWAGDIYGAGSSFGGGGLIYNAGLWQAVAENAMSYYSGNPTNLFINVGTLEKIGGSTGTSTIGWNFDNEAGTINTPSGSFSMANWIGSGLVHGNATFLSGTIAGTLASDAVMNFSATINDSLTVSSNAVANWFGGDLEGSLTVAQGGTLTISNTVIFAYNNYEYGYTNTATLTNYGTVVWAGTIYADAYITGLGGGIIDNAGLWESVADNTMSPTYDYPSTSFFINTGTLEKIGGTNTSTIGWNFLNNGGILGSQTNTLSLAGNYDLTGGTLNFGINSLGNYGIINLSGSPATLTGSVSANLNNGYVPATGSSFPVLTYGSESGVFANFLPPFAVAMQTNYGGTVFTLTVLNVRPMLAAIANQTVDELKALNVTASATDPDIGQTLTFALVSAPGGISINPTTGAISWTPAQTQSPSTNTVLVSVTDNGTPPLSATNSFSVVVKEVNVAPSLPTISTQIVNELTLLTVNNTATNFNIHSTITGYGLINPPAGMSINASGIITWTPTQTQSPGTNTITTVVTNSNPYDTINPSLTSTNSFTVIVKEVNVAPVLPVVTQTNVNELTRLTVTNTATDSNIHATVSYSLLNPLAGMAIDTNGVITWTPSQIESPGTNIITTVATSTDNFDQVNPRLTATNSFTVIVKEVNVAPVLAVIAQTNVNAQALLTVTNAATESNIHATLGYALVSPPTGMSISASGVITWTPARSQGPGTNVITTIVTNTDAFDTVNPHLSATNSFTVIVYAPTLAPIGNYTVNAGQTVAFTASATDNDPARTLTFSLIAPPSGAGIGSSSGVFNWRLAVAQANTTNTVQVQVTDNSTPSLSDTKSFTVTVNPLAPVVLTPKGYANGQFKFQVSGSTGPDYIIAASTNLTAWSDIFTNLSPSTPFQFTNSMTFTNRFYRVRLSP